MMVIACMHLTLNQKPDDAIINKTAKLSAADRDVINVLLEGLPKDKAISRQQFAAMVGEDKESVPGSQRVSLAVCHLLHKF
jgi:hypothetical protein